MPRRVLNLAQVGTDGGKISSESPRVLHAILSHFFNDGVLHWSVSNNSSGEQISGHW